MEGNDAVSANNALGEKMSGVTEGPNKTEVADKPYSAEGFDSVSVVSAKDCYELCLHRQEQHIHIVMLSMQEL